MRHLLLALATTCCLPTAVHALDLNLPVLGDYSSASVSITEENRIGDYMLRRLQGSGSTLDDPALESYVTDILYQLAPYSNLPNTNLNVVVLDTTELNAFAVPGALIGINAGMLMYTDNQDQLASVLAHELSHLSQRHYALQRAQQERERPYWIAATIAGILAGVASGNADVGGAAVTSSLAANQGRSLAFSRLHEAEADRIGIAVLANAGFDPQAMPDMLSKLQRDYGNSTKVPEMLLSHPLTEKRIADSQARAATYPRRSHAADTRFLMMQARARVLLNKANQATLSYYQSRVKELPSDPGGHYGLALTYIERKQPTAALSELQWLEQKQHDSLLIQALRARYLAESGQGASAISYLKQHLALFPDNLMLGRLLAQIYEDQNQLQSARALLEDLIAAHPEQAGLWYDLSEVRGKLKDTFGIHDARIEYFLRTASWEDAERQIRYARSTRGITVVQNDLLDAKENEVKEWKQWEKDMR